MRPKCMLMISVFCLVCASSGFSLDDHSYAHGWYWGEDPVFDHFEDSEQKKEKRQRIKPSLSHQQKLREISKQLDEAKAHAILEPTEAHVKQYIVIQNKVIQMASGFSHTWQKVLLKHPALDYTVKHPTHNGAIQTIKKLDREKIDNTLSNFSKAYGLLFFYRGQEVLSDIQAQIMQRFSKTYHLSIIPVSLDGIGSRYFQHSRFDQGQAGKLGVETTPAIVALNPKTGMRFPIAYGVLSEAELAKRIVEVWSDVEEVPSP